MCAVWAWQHTLLNVFPTDGARGRRNHVRRTTTGRATGVARRAGRAPAQSPVPTLLTKAKHGKHPSRSSVVTDTVLPLPHTILYLLQVNISLYLFMALYGIVCMPLHLYDIVRDRSGAAPLQEQRSSRDQVHLNS
jgi:hypothetical protein